MKRKSDYIKKMSDERIAEKLQYYHEQQIYWQRNSANFMFNSKYQNAVKNYNRYLREWAKRQNIRVVSSCG